MKLMLFYASFVHIAYAKLVGWHLESVALSGSSNQITIYLLCNPLAVFSLSKYKINKLVFSLEHEYTLCQQLAQVHFAR